VAWVARPDFAKPSVMPIYKTWSWYYGDKINVLQIKINVKFFNSIAAQPARCFSALSGENEGIHKRTDKGRCFSAAAIRKS
jgi:hypothetical protein